MTQKGYLEYFWGSEQEKCQWTVEFLKDGIWRNKNGEEKWGKKKAVGKGDIENYVSTL